MTSSANVEISKRLSVLIADGRLYTRTLLRSMLLQLGVKSVHEISDGAAALDAIYNLSPDIVIVDWDLPVLSVPDFLRMTRSPGVLPNPDLPIIVISNTGTSQQVNEAVRLGAKQFLVRPISLKVLEQRLLSLVMQSRVVAQAGDLRDHRQSQHPVR